MTVATRYCQESVPKWERGTSGESLRPGNGDSAGCGHADQACCDPCLAPGQQGVLAPRLGEQAVRQLAASSNNGRGGRQPESRSFISCHAQAQAAGESTALVATQIFA
jgi:hypothetical protein